MGQLLEGWRVGSEKSEVCWGLGGYREGSGTHPAGGQLPVEGLGPRQHVLHAQLHGQLVDVLRAGVGQACLPASTQPPPPERLLCASCRHTIEGRQTGLALLGLTVGLGDQERSCSLQLLARRSIHGRERAPSPTAAAPPHINALGQGQVAHSCMGHMLCEDTAGSQG